VDLNTVFTELPCLSCGCAQRDRVLHVLGALYLILEKGGTPRVPARAELMAQCCRREQPSLNAITYLNQSLLVLGNCITGDDRERGRI
jgi:hypothetical protein